MRDSDFESSLREFRITSAGFEVARTFDSAEAILSGFSQLKSAELETILGDESYRVLTACNGKQGLVRLAGEQPEVILLDFMMSVLSGCQMLRAMALEPAYQRIPVIIMSSLSEGVVAERCRGYAGFLHKPFRVAAVLTTVARVLGAGVTDTV